MIPKFRASSKLSKLLFEVIEIDFSRNHLGLGKCLSNQEKEFHSFEHQLENFNVMMSTGLKDKNGVEIFEGGKRKKYCSS